MFKDHLSTRSFKSLSNKFFPAAVLLLLFLQGPVYAQQFVPGYIITSEKDTVQGYLLEQIDKELVGEVKFKERTDSEVRTFTSEEIAGFGLGYGRIFHSFKPSDNETEKGEGNLVFAKQVETGKIDVLVWRRGKRRRPDMFLVNRETRDTVHITKPGKDFIVTEEGKHYSREDQIYLRLLSDVKGEEFDQKKIRYSENSIRKEIRSYNTAYADEYTVASYDDRTERGYMILLGTAVDRLSNEQPRFRGAIIQTRTSIEKTNTISYISGLFYTYRERKDLNLETSRSRTWNGEINFRRQLVSVVPVGVKFQTKPRRLRPYAYAGLGLAVAKLDDHLIESLEIVGGESSYTFGPNLVAGAGAKFRIGSNYIIGEISPSIEGFHLNLGFSF